MRLSEIERGDSFGHRALIGFISMIAGMRLPDAARVAFYHQEFTGKALGAWTQATMRGPSSWSVAERELVASLVAKWNACTFCVGAHRAIAVKGMPPSTVEAAHADYRAAPLSPELIATLVFLEKMTRTPNDLTAADAKAALEAGVTREALTDAAAVATLFNIVTRYADALDFAIPTPEDFDKSAKMLLKRGYGA
jgi:uncharacterized peroxidase-related enzyme